MGIRGVSLATCITYFLNFILITIYATMNKDLKKSWFFFNKDSTRNIGEYLRIAIPGTLMLVFEWWTFEILTLMAGYMHSDDLYL